MMPLPHENIDGYDLLEQERVPQTLWHGLWPGTVISTEDPLKRGQIRVRLPQVYGDPTNEEEFIPDDDLPWAKPSFPTHDFQVPDVGDGVWVSFWGGMPQEPIWHGQFLGEGDSPDEFVSAYTPEPKTRFIRTSNGHTIEMRFVAGQEKIRVKTAAGLLFDMLDADAEGGPKISASTPDGYAFELDQKAKKATLKTPTQSAEIDDATPKMTVTATGVLNVLGVTTLNLTANALIATLAAAATIAVTAGSLTLTAATLILASVTGLVSLGQAGAKKKLVHEDYITVIQAPNVTAYNGHTHPFTETGVPGPYNTLGPSAAMSPATVGAHATANVEAN